MAKRGNKDLAEYIKICQALQQTHFKWQWVRNTREGAPMELNDVISRLRENQQHVVVQVSEDGWEIFIPGPNSEGLDDLAEQLRVFLLRTMTES